MKTVLISGAGVAGLTAAYWLHRAGYAPTVVERAPAHRLSGQAIDVRGPALDVVGRMGVVEGLRQVRTQMRGMTVVDGEGKEIESRTDWTFSTGKIDNDDVEVLREDLTRLLLGAAADGTECLFDDSVTALTQDEDGVRVEFEHTAPRSVDLVIGADGLHSKVRELTFGAEREVTHHLGSYLSVCTAENFLGLDNWQIWHHGPDAGYGIYPVHDNAELRISFSFNSGPIEFDHRDTQQQKKLTAERVAHLRGHAPRMVEALWASPDFYLDAMAQIRMDHWSRGRVVLIGDAAHCASPMTGQGTSLALVGAWALGDELKRAQGDYRTAFTRYEHRVRPFVLLNQQLVNGDPADPDFVTGTFETAKNAFTLSG